LVVNLPLLGFAEGIKLRRYVIRITSWLLALIINLSETQILSEEKTNFLVTRANERSSKPMTGLRGWLTIIERDGCLPHLSSDDDNGFFDNVVYVCGDTIDLLYRKFIANSLNTNAPTEHPSLKIPPVEQTWGMKEFCVSGSAKTRRHLATTYP
jgi:hypothetical protein